MQDILITCPRCGHEFPLSDALLAQINARLADDHQAQLQAAVREAEQRTRGELTAQLSALQKLLDEQSARAQAAEARELELKRQALELEQAQRQAVERARLETEERLRREAEERLKAQVAQAEAQARAAAALELKQLQQRLAQEQAKLQQAQQAELELRRRAEELEARARELDLELARRLDAKKAEWEQQLRQSLTVEHELKLKERDKQIDDLKRLIDEMKRKSEQGSQELQGEVLELDIQAALERQFPQDVIRPVPKGMTGADLIQEVRDGVNECGRIIWEVKNTKHYSAQWIDKLKADQRAAGAALAILVSHAMPEGVRGFARIDGVWVSDLAHYPMLAVALREQMVQVAFARAANAGRNEKMAQLYDYLASDAFRHRVEAIVEAYRGLREQIERERRVMLKHWAERERLLERAITGAAGMYGDLKGIIGQSLADIPALEADASASLLEDKGGVGAA
ncbi:MAG: DUF2130 domain-containing protein [Thiobacillaceae bacterium]|nr:DUF2130 domain-containing protein [Thiobacillaceae bacterium]